MLLPELRARSAFWRSLPDGRGAVAKHYREHRTNEWFVEGVYD